MVTSDQIPMFISSGVKPGRLERRDQRNDMAGDSGLIFVKLLEDPQTTLCSGFGH